MAAKDTCDGLGRLSAIPEPMTDAIILQCDGRWIGQRVVKPNLLDEPSVTWRTGFRGHNTVTGALLGTHASESKFNHAVELPTLYCNAATANPLLRLENLQSK